jgi:hypothetical protein
VAALDHHLAADRAPARGRRMIAAAALGAALRRNLTPGLLWLVAAAGAGLFVWGLHQKGIERGRAACERDYWLAAEAARESRALAGRKVEQGAARAMHAIERRFEVIEQEAAHAPESIATHGGATLDAPAAGACFGERDLRLWNDANAAVGALAAAGGADRALPAAAAADRAGRPRDPAQPHPLDAPARALRADEGGPGALDREPEPIARAGRTALDDASLPEEIDR